MIILRDYPSGRELHRIDVIASPPRSGEVVVLHARVGGRVKPERYIVNYVEYHIVADVDDSYAIIDISKI